MVLDSFADERLRCPRRTWQRGPAAVQMSLSKNICRADMLRTPSMANNILDHPTENIEL